LFAPSINFVANFNFWLPTFITPKFGAWVSKNLTPAFFNFWFFNQVANLGVLDMFPFSKSFNTILLNFSVKEVISFVQASFVTEYDVGTDL